MNVLGEVCERFGWRVHAWCLMDNHYHLLLETPEANLSAGMRQLNGVWSQCFNRAHGRVGHVFQERYKAIMVERQGYLLELARYVVLNPLRARMETDLGRYEWSSYRATAGLDALKGADEPMWLETQWLLAQFGTKLEAARLAYVDFVRAGVGLPSVWASLRNQVFLGGDEFLREMTAKLQDMEAVREVPRLQRRPLPKPLEAYCAGMPREDAMVAAYRSGTYRLRELAEFFGVHESTISRAGRRALPGSGWRAMDDVA